jgi:hypothetical protein
MSAFFSVKNFERFQHYKDRAPPWIKLYNELLENYEFGALPDEAKGQLIGLWLLASRMENKLPSDPEWLAKKINATCPVNLDTLIEAGFIEPFEADRAAGKREKWPSRYIPDVVRAEIMERDSHKCVRCGSDERLEIDHIVPISQGGTGDKENLQVLCVSCNRKKRAEQSRRLPSADATQMRSPEREGETETEERKTEGDISADALTPSEVVDFPAGKNTEDGRYAFITGVIRLNKRSLDQWVEAFSYLDVKAELLSLSEWAEREHPKNWFHAVSGALAKRNRQAKERAAASTQCKDASTGVPRFGIKPGDPDAEIYRYVR